MLKTYKFKEKTHKAISSRRVSIHYVLVDSQGEERTVIAIAKLGMTKRIKSIQPIYHRETPLVAALLKASLNDMIRVDFSEFNKKNSRISSALSKAQAAKRLKKGSLTQSSFALNDFSVDPFRLLQLFLIASVSFAAFLSV